jgi:hypothetical protein
MSILAFWINLPIGAATGMLILILRIPEQTHKAKFVTTLPRIHHHLDLLGFILFAPSVIQLLLALQYGGVVFAWNSSQVIGLFCGAGVTFIVWLIWNVHQGDKALLPRSMVRRRTVWSAVLFNAFQMVGIFGLFYYLPVYFQAIYDVTAILSGVYIIPMILPQLLTAALTGAVRKSELGDHMLNYQLIRRNSTKDRICHTYSHFLSRSFLHRDGSHVNIDGG